MKKVCKLVKLTVVAVAIWQTIASYYKDKKFKEEFDTTKWFDKFKVIFNNLFDLNKRFFAQIKDIDLQQTYNDAKNFIEDNLAKINLKIDELKENLNNLKEDKLIPLLKDLEEKSEEFKEQIKSNIDDISEKIKLEEKVKIIEEKIKEMKKKFNN